MTFSIIIPVYNVEKYISQCLESLVNQDLDSSDFEILVIDDCSPDRSIDIAIEYQKQYTNLKIIRHEKNKYQGGARNTGIRLATGDYVMFVDSDDILLYKNTLSTLKKYINVPDNKSFDIIKSISYGDINKVVTAHNNILKIHSNGYEHFKSDYYIPNIWTALYKRVFLIENNLYFRENISYEDTDWTLKVFHKATNTMMIDYPFYGYRYNTESVTNKLNIKSFTDNVISAVELYDYIHKNVDIPEVRKDAFLILKRRIKTLPHTARNYSVSDGVKAFSSLRRCNVLINSEMRLSFLERIYFTILHHNPGIILFIIRFLTFSKRYFLKSVACLHFNS